MSVSSVGSNTAIAAASEDETTPAAEMTDEQVQDYILGWFAEPDSEFILEDD